VTPLEKNEVLIMSRDVIRQILTISALGMTVTINALANILPINGVTTGEVTESRELFFLPASYVFSVWGVIYLLLLGYVIFQALPRQKHNPILRRIAPWFIAGCFANVTWLFLWHYGFIWLSTAAMVVLLLTLLVIYVMLGIGRYAAPRAERWWVQLPFSVYAGWITVATVANFTVALQNDGWDGWGIAPDIWALIMLVVAALITLIMNVRHRDVAYALVIVWAFVGIVVRQRETLTVAAPAAILALVILLTLFVNAPGRAEKLRAS
jgi:hypothetical protein